MYKIYVNDHSLFICTEAEAMAIKPSEKASYSESGHFTFDSTFYQRLQSSDSLALISENPEKAMQGLFSQTLIIEAAGGLVFNPDRSKILFIFRRGKWDLPKGKIDHGEQANKAAWREVAEECGIKSHAIIEYFESSYHVYELNKQFILKKTHWYLMQAEEEALIPQLDEDITKAEWLPFTEYTQQIKGNTYPLIADLLLKLVQD